MSYSTIEDIKKLIPEVMLIQLTDDESTGAMGAARVAEAIAQADGEIDSYCAARYAVPFTAAPATVKKCSVDMAIYNLYSRRVEKIPETRADRYKNAVRLLEGIAKGAISIGIDASLPAPTGGDRIESTARAADRSVTREGLSGF